MSPDLFGNETRGEGRGEDPLAPAPDDAPLAERMRPRTLDDYVGQEHLVGEGKILRRMLQDGLSQSLILWGPPGSGKTTLARILAAGEQDRFVPFSAVMSGIKEIRGVMAESATARERDGRRTVLFVDEIHRFNKAQQDAFLPYVERGDILLIGATTENPSFEIVGPLLSRSRTVVLKPLAPEVMVVLLRRALEEPRGLAGTVEADDDVLKRLAHATDGDARRGLTLLETAALLAQGRAAETDAPAHIDQELLGEALQQKLLLYDKSGEEHFNLISALHKSVRNSNPHATLYWLTRMLEAGEDRRYLSRRLIRMSVEDIGLAEPFALRVCLDAAEAFERLGTPEGELALVQAAVYLARAKKSNKLYTGYAQAQRDVRETTADPVPLHLRNASTKLMEEAGYGEGYRYAHDDPAAAEEMDCMPPSLEGRKYF